MEKIKAIYTFNVNLVKEVEENGEKVKKITTYPFAIRKPSRSEKEEAELVRSEYLGKYIRRGVLPEAILNKTYENQGGTLNEQERAYSTILQSKLFDKTEELKLATIGKDKEKEELLLKEIIGIQQEMTSVQYRQSRFFENTAEFKAKTKLIEYLFTQLTYWKPAEDKEWEPYFKADSFEAALDEVEKLEDDENEIYLKMKDKALFAVSMFIHLAGNVKPEDIEKSVKENLGDE
jgi:hypothetical protein